MGESEGEKHKCVVAFHAPLTGDLACNPGICLTGNRTGDTLVRRLALKPLNHTSQGKTLNSIKVRTHFKGQLMVQRK